MEAVNVGSRKSYKTGDQVLAVHEEDGIGYGYRGEIVSPVFNPNPMVGRTYMVKFSAHPAAANGNLAGKTVEVSVEDLILSSDWKLLA